MFQLVLLIQVEPPVALNKSVREGVSSSVWHGPVCEVSHATRISIAIIVIIRDIEPVGQRSSNYERVRIRYTAGCASIPLQTLE